MFSSEERNIICPHIMSETISSDENESQIFGAKNADFHSSAEEWHPCIEMKFGILSSSP